MVCSWSGCWFCWCVDGVVAFGDVLVAVFVLDAVECYVVCLGIEPFRLPAHC